MILVHNYIVLIDNKWYITFGTQLHKVFFLFARKNKKTFRD